MSNGEHRAKVRRSLFGNLIRISVTMTISVTATFAVGIEVGKREIRNEYAAADSVVIAYGPVPPPDTLMIVPPATAMTLQDQQEQIGFLRELLLEKPDTVRVKVPAPFPVVSPPKTVIVNHWFPASPETVYTDAPPPLNPWGSDPRRPRRR